MMRRKLSLALAVILAVSLFTLPAQAADNRFTDVPSTHWAHDAIEYVVDKDLFAGTSATTFSPEGTMLYWPGWMASIPAKPMAAHGIRPVLTGP